MSLEHATVRQRHPAFEADAWYSARDLARRWAVHPITIWKWAAKGIIPPSVKLGPNCTRWKGSTILQHEAALAAER